MEKTRNTRESFVTDLCVILSRHPGTNSVTEPGARELPAIREPWALDDPNEIGCLDMLLELIAALDDDHGRFTSSAAPFTPDKRSGIQQYILS